MRIKTPNEFEFIILKLNDFFSRIALLKNKLPISEKELLSVSTKKEELAIAMTNSSF